MREKVVTTRRGDGYQFLEAKLGSYPFNGVHAGFKVHVGSPITWRFEEIESGELLVEREDGVAVTLRWDEVALDPGWCKLDWVVSDPNRKQLSNASNVMDVTWEGPDGEIVPLDGYLDSFFQEVYLDADSVPVFAKVAKFVSDDALDNYVEQMQIEVRKYLTKSLNYGKAAKRMYNLFRLSGRYNDAAFVRELFDEPATILYQVWSLISTLDNATQPDSSIPVAEVRAQTDELILAVVNALEGDEEAELVKALLGLRQTLEAHDLKDLRTAQVEAARTQVVNLINTFFRDKLESMPSIREFIHEIQHEDELDPAKA